MNLHHLPELGAGGRQWVLDTLLEGMALARLVRETIDLDQLSVYAVISGDVSLDRLERDFSEGLPAHEVRRSTALTLTSVIPENYASLHLILELPEDGPSARWFTYPTGGTPTRMTCGEEVYAVCPIGEDRELLSNTLMYRDRTWAYHAFVVDGLPPDAIVGCPTRLFKEGVISIRAILVGAYDGEGYLLAVLSSPIKHSSRTGGDRPN